VQLFISTGQLLNPLKREKKSLPYWIVLRCGHVSQV
jgi:hypothetical protein